MPIKIGLLPCQQESFEHHEELSKLSNETEVFYVPLYQDLSDLTKRFDEDILNKHLVVVRISHGVRRLSRPVFSLDIP